MRKAASLCLLMLSLPPSFVSAQTATKEADHPVEPSIASGTLNIVLANKNGFVIATDSRMSSDRPFLCSGKLQRYCDESQKLFRTTSHSAIAIAGFAVGRGNTPTPFDLAVAPVLRRVFGKDGLAIDDESDEIPGIIEVSLSEPLLGVAAIQDPRTPSGNLSITITFARINRSHAPVLQQLLLSEDWIPTGPLQVRIPRYTSRLGPAISAATFSSLTAGIDTVASVILAGNYSTADPVIKRYYQLRANRQLYNMSLDDMSALAHAILRETGRAFPAYIGGDDQIGEFGADGNADFRLPNEIPTETVAVHRLIRWDGLLCTDEQRPPCGNAPLSFSISRAQPIGEVRFEKFLLGSQFKDVPVLLDDNLFIADDFDGVTLKWYGSPFFSFRNQFHNCVLELSLNAKISLHPELAPCRLVRKGAIELPADTIGLPLHTLSGPNGSFSLPGGIQP